MMKIEAFGKSCVFGFIGGRFRIHCTTAEKIKRFEDLVFRVHPKDERKKMAKADFSNGYTVCVIPVNDTGHVYYHAVISKAGDEKPSLTSSYCSVEMINGILEYYQTKKE